MIRLPPFFQKIHQIELSHFFTESIQDKNPEKSFKVCEGHDQGDLSGASDTTCFYTFMGLNIGKMVGYKNCPFSKVLVHNSNLQKRNIEEPRNNS